MPEPREPLIHSHITDSLPDTHPLAWDAIMCANGCRTMVHASNNECMSTWVETGRGNYCLPCWYKLAVNEWGCIEDEWALPTEESNG